MSCTLSLKNIELFVDVIYDQKFIMASMIPVDVIFVSVDSLCLVTVATYIQICSFLYKNAELMMREIKSCVLYMTQTQSLN